MELDTLYNRDCIKGMAEIPEGSIDLAFADPPFNIGYKYDAYKDRLAADKYLDGSKKWGAALVRTLKPNGTFWLAIGDDFAAELKLIFQRELGLCCRCWVVWYYTFGVNCKYKFSRSHTHLFYFVKDPRNFTFKPEEIRVPSARQLVYGDARADARGRLPDDTWILRPQDASNSFTPEEDVWYFPRVCGTFKERAGWHGCQMPELLLARIIKSCSNPGDTVLDPFGGSGTTLAVAKKLDRRFIGYELSKNYAAQVRSRLRSASVGDAISGVDDRKLVAPPTPSLPVVRVRSGPRYLRTQKQPSRAAPHRDVEESSEKQSDRAVLNRGVEEAFIAIRNGFPVDRVIADPEINEAFIAQCTRLGLRGGAYEWNHRLMGLRKAGRLKGTQRSQRTEAPFARQDFDRYKFACEIAMQRFEQEEDAELDHVLCDPDLAQRFDQFVLTMLPDKPSSFEIRWFALRLRKAAKNISEHSGWLRRVIGMPKAARNPFDLNDVPAEPGLYWLAGGDAHLYVGETENLRERFERQFGHRKFDFWGQPLEKLSLSFRAASQQAEELPKHQSRWIEKWQPIGNYKRLSART